MNDRYYILSPDYCFRGWKLLPYAVQQLYAPRTVFLREAEWKLLTACDGKTPIALDLLSDRERSLYSRWEQQGYINPCTPGTMLKPEQMYCFFPARFKESVQWSITGRCNYRCKHCFLSAPHAIHDEPTWEQLMVMLDAFHRCGIKGIQLTGGEPTVRQDFWQLADEIVRRGMVITAIYTNGRKMTDNFFDELLHRKMHPVIQFSYDGVGHHDWMRGFDGAEEAVVSAMHRCRDRGLRASASMVLFKENLNSIRDTVNLLAELGCIGLQVGNASPQGEWLHQQEHYLTQQEVYAAFLEYIPQYFADGMPLSLELEGFFRYDKMRGELSAPFEKNTDESSFGSTLMCGHVRRELYVSPQGYVLPCMLMAGTAAESDFPNLLDTPLERILDGESRYMEIVNYRVSDFLSHNPECQTCRFRTQCCGGCRAMALRDNSNDYLAKDITTCMYYKDGWKDKKETLLRQLRTHARKKQAENYERKTV